MRRVVAPPDPEAAVGAAFGGKAERGFAAKTIEKSKVERMRVSVDDQGRNS
jgi:hypothetical protein